MRAIERTAARAGVPLRYTQGFNPRPVLSLVAPRPTAVATDADLLVLETEDRPDTPQGDALLHRLNDCAPEGMRFRRIEGLPEKTSPRPARITYELPLREEQVEGASHRLAALGERPSWEVERPIHSKRRGRGRARTIDLKPMIARIDLLGEPGSRRLRWTAVPDGDLWPRPAEVLRLLGLDARVDLARVMRTSME